MRSLTVLVDGENDLIQEPFLTHFFETYWDMIALAIPVTAKEDFSRHSYFDVINRGYMVDWLLAIMPNSRHPLNIDWVCLRPRQHHPWGYGNHPATDNFNGGGSTVCLYETLALIEALAEDDRVAEYCEHFPELYLDAPPETFSYYTSDVFNKHYLLERPDRESFKSIIARLDGKDLSKSVCLGLYGFSDDLLNAKWQVECLTRSGSWTATTMELADKATLALRLAGKSDEVTQVSPADAFGQWGRNSKPIQLEPLLIRMNGEVLLCRSQLERPYSRDAYFLDCDEQTLERRGANGKSSHSILSTWGIHPKDSRLSFLS